MTGETFEGLLQWQQAKASRKVSVNIEPGKPVQTWVYDYDLTIGQFVNSADEIDLLKKRRDQLDRWIAERQEVECDDPNIVQDT